MSYSILDIELFANTCRQLNFVMFCRWNSQSVLHLAGMFKDIALTNEELRFVLEKIIRMMKELELTDLPSLVYQLLLLSTKVRNCDLLF